MEKRLLNFASLAISCAFALVLSSHISVADAAVDAARALIAVDADWSNAAIARNVDAVAPFYAEEGVAYPPNEPAAVGRTAARKVWSGYFADPTFQISWKTTQAGVEKNTGWTVGTYQDSFKGPDGKTVVEKGKYVTVWRKSGTANGRLSTTFGTATPNRLRGRSPRRC